MKPKEPTKNSLILISDPTSHLIQPTPFSIKEYVFEPIKNAFTTLLSFIPVLEPTHPAVLAIDILTAATITYYYFEITLVLVFEDKFWKDQFTYPVTITINVFNMIVLWTSLVLEFKRGYYEQGILVLDQKEIIKNIGVFNLINMVYSATIVSLGFYTQVFFINYLKLGFLLRLTTLRRIDKNIQKHLLRSRNLCTIYLIARLFLILVFISHVMGLLFYVLDRYLLLSNYFGDETSSQCWLATSQSYTNLYQSRWSTQYLYTFYWAVNYLTSIAFGDIAPLNAIEAGFVGVISMASIFHFNYFVFMIVKILMEHRLKSDQHVNNRNQVSEFLFKNLDRHSYQSIMNTYELSKENKRLEYQIKDIIKALPNKLQHNLLGIIYQQFLFESNMLNLFPLSLTQKLLFIIKIREVDEGENVYQNDNDLNLYYLKEGIITFCYSEKYHIETIQQGPFDLLEFLSGHKKRLIAQAVAPSILYEIDRKEFLELVNSNEEYIELFRYKVDLIDSGKEGKVIDLRCMICQESHLTQRCPQTLFHIKQSPRPKEFTQRRVKARRRNYERMKFYNEARRVDDQYEELSEAQEEMEDVAHNDINPLYIHQMIKDLEREGKDNGIEVDVGRNYKYYFPGFNISSIEYFWTDNFSQKSSSE